MEKEITWTLPVGVDSFTEIREEKHYFVDKTMFISDFLKNKEKVTLITRPRRFGKTLNMSMMRDFFDITQNNIAIFEGLRIMNTEYAHMINSRPTLYLTFKGVTGKNFDALKLSLAHAVKEGYYKHATALNKSECEENEFFAIYKAFKKMDQETDTDKRKIDSDVLKRSLTVLIHRLYEHFQKPILLLIDEYDQPLIEAHASNCREEFSSQIYGPFLGDALKGNESLGQSLLTGIQRVAKESIFSKLNNVAVYTVADETYATYFGLTETETKTALQDNGLKLLDSVKEYYDGYRIGDVDIYNPWSIINYMKRKKLEPYWVNTSTNLLARQLILTADSEFFMDFETLIKEGEVDIFALLDASFIELESTETIWGLLINAGYITISKKIGMEEYVVRIPNFEVKKEFRTIVGLYTNIKASNLNGLFNALFDKNMNRFLMLYRKMILRHLSYHDIIDENSFHMFFLGMCMASQGFYQVMSNREMGHGRSDIGMKSLFTNDRPHIIIEFKTGKNVKKESENALEQIFEKAYYSQFAGDVLCIGIGHDKKQCELVSRLIQVNEFGAIAPEIT